MKARNSLRSSTAVEGDYVPSPAQWVREQVEAYELSGGQRAVAAFPPYADYQKKTDREIPVFVASRQG